MAIAKAGNAASGKKMLASNKDVLEYHFHGKPQVNILRTDKYDKYFTLERQYSGSAGPFERGWIYAAIGNREVSSFITLGFDEKQRMLFNEIRYKDKTYPLGEGFCNSTTTFYPDHLEISDALRELKWGKSVPNYEIEMKAKTPDSTKPFGQITLNYKFEEALPDLGKYKCVFSEFNEVFAYWMISPAKGTLSIDAKGDLSQFRLNEAEDLVGKTIESKFAYNENIHFKLPMIGEGWNWTILGCFKHKEDEQPAIFISYMEQFIKTNEKIPIFTQLYVIDLEKGTSELYNEAQATLSWREDKTPLLTIATPDREIEITITPKSAQTISRHQIRGLPITKFLYKTECEYTTYPSVASVKINGTTYDAIGTSEVTGAEKFCYWI